MATHGNLKWCLVTVRPTQQVGKNLEWLVTRKSHWTNPSCLFSRVGNKRVIHKWLTSGLQPIRIGRAITNMFKNDLYFLMKELGFFRSFPWGAKHGKQQNSLTVPSINKSYTPLDPCDRCAATALRIHLFQTMRCQQAVFHLDAQRQPIENN